MAHSTRRQTIFIGVFLFVVVVYLMTFRQVMVRGDSMESTYHDGQVVLVRLRNVFNRQLKHGDVVVLRKDRDVIIKRVAFLPGETVENPFVLQPTFANHVEDYYEQPGPQTLQHPTLVVPAGYIVVLGDNRRVSYDSRIFGPVALSDVVGVVVSAPPPPPEAAP